MYNFRNDYSQGAHPDVLQAVIDTNMIGIEGYGQDEYCKRAADKIREACKAPNARVEFLIGGTQTNVVTMAWFLRPWESAICAETAHLNGHEVGAAEATGHKLIQVPVGPDGKIRPEQIPPIMQWHSDEHLTKPAYVYISQATENGTVYTKAELKALSEMCKQYGLALFVDGARLGVALTSEGCDVTLADLAEYCDAFYIGGTKNGAMMGEALVLVDGEKHKDFFRFKKQRFAVLAKGWLLGAQFDALFTDDLYWKLGRHANQMAQRLQKGFQELGWELMVESPTNQVFVIAPNSLLPKLDELCIYEYWCDHDADHTVIRFVCNFATKQEDVDGLLAALKNA